MESKAQLQFSVMELVLQWKMKENFGKMARNRQKFGEKGISAEREVHETKAQKYMRIRGRKGN